MKTNWEKAFKEEFGIHFKGGGELQFSIAFIEDLLKEQKQEMVKIIKKRKIVLEELIKKFDLDIDKNRLDELNQLKQNLTE